MKTGKAWLVLLLAACLVLSTACQGGGASTNPPNQVSKDEVTFMIYNNMIEIDTALRNIAKKYKEVNPNVNIEIETRASDTYVTDLRTRFVGGSAPDLFIAHGNTEIKTWLPYLEDLSNESWIKEIMPSLLEEGMVDGKTYGFPMAITCGGYIYNKDLFAQAGIEDIPRTRDAFQDAITKLQAIGVIPLIETYNGYYQPGNYFVSYAFAKLDDPLGFIEGLNNGTETMVGNDAFLEMAEYWLWESKMCTNPMGYDFNTQVSMIANQEAAMTYGGNWSQLAFDDVDPNLPLGLMPVPISNNASDNDYLLCEPQNYWVINKGSDEKKEAVKAFLNWLFTTAEGQKAFSEELRMVSAFQSFGSTEDELGSLNKDAAHYFNAGKVKNFYRGYFPDGGAQAFGEAMGKMVAGKLTPEQFVQTMQDDWERLLD